MNDIINENLVDRKKKSRIIYIIIGLIVLVGFALVLLSLINKPKDYIKIGNIALPVNSKKVYITNNNLGFGIETKVDGRKIDIYYLKDELENKNPSNYLKTEKIYDNYTFGATSKKYVKQYKLKNGLFIGKYKVKYDEDYYIEYGFHYICIFDNDVYAITFSQKDKISTSDEKLIDNMINNIKKIDTFYDFTNYDIDIDSDREKTNIIYQNGNTFRYDTLKLNLSSKYKILDAFELLYNYKNEIMIGKDTMDNNSIIHYVDNVDSFKYYYDNYKLIEEESPVKITEKEYIETNNYNLIYFYVKSETEGEYINYYINPTDTDEIYDITIKTDNVSGNDLIELKSIYKNISICNNKCDNEQCECN